MHLPDMQTSVSVNFVQTVHGGKKMHNAAL